LIFGDYNPGEKLPLNFPKSTSDLPTWGSDYTDDYTERRGYEYFDKQEIEPLFPFGHGLSYTEFEYSSLEINPKGSSDGQVTVSFAVGNTGDMEGDEVVQLYIHDLEKSTDDQPVKELKGFYRVHLIPGESKTLGFKLTPEHLAFHDDQLNFLVEPGIFNVMVGSSSRDIRLEGFFDIMEEIIIR
jgi:beta-glucosidase